LVDEYIVGVVYGLRCAISTVKWITFHIHPVADWT